MNLIFNIATAWSMRDELYYVALTFILMLLLPTMAFVVFTNTGFNQVSNKLVTVNPTTHTIELRDPVTGRVIKEISQPMVWPLSATVTLEFGQSDLPYQPFHTGIDIAGKYGSPIAAFMDGKVIYAGEINWGFGKHIILDNGNNIQSIYAHLSQINVTQGDTIKAGQIIGEEGQTGWATGPHLHFQININGIPVNPRTF